MQGEAEPIDDGSQSKSEWFDDYIDRLAHRSIVRGQRHDGKYACPCCRHLTLTERGGFEICPVCFWEDDGQDDADADYARGGPNGNLSLTQARRYFLECGASHTKWVKNVRPPREEELPGTGSR